MSLIQIRGLGVASPRVLFQNLDLSIHEPDRIGLIAGNGMGKTTLLRCLARQERLEAEILAHAATCLLVSHDRFFVRAIRTRYLRIEDGGLVELDRPEA